MSFGILCKYLWRISLAWLSRQQLIGHVSGRLTEDGMKWRDKVECGRLAFSPMTGGSLFQCLRSLRSGGWPLVSAYR